MSLLFLLLISSVCLLLGFVFGRITSQTRQEIDRLGEARVRISDPIVAPMVDVRAAKRTPIPHVHAPAAH